MSAEPEYRVTLTIRIHGDADPKYVDRVEQALSDAGKSYEFDDQKVGVTGSCVQVRRPS